MRSLLFVQQRWCLFLALLLWPPQAELAKAQACSRSFQLLCGKEGRYYWKVGEAIRSAGKSHGLEVVVVGTDGSKENVQRLLSKQADFAIVQSDVVHRSWMNEPPFHRNKNRLESGQYAIRLIAPLFIEKVQILTRAHEYVSRSSDLKGKKIWLGLPESGSRFTATNVLLASKFNSFDFESSSINTIDFNAALELLGAGVLHAVYSAEEPPSQSLRSVGEEAGIVRAGQQTQGGFLFVLRGHENPGKWPWADREMKIWMGEVGGKTERAAIAEFEKWNIEKQTLLDHRVYDLEFKWAAELLKAGYLDAMVQSTVSPNADIEDVIQESEFRFIGLDWNVVESLSTDVSYLESSIQRQDYKQVLESVPTVGVQALLVAGPCAEDRAISLLANLVYGQRENIEAALREVIIKEREKGAKFKREPDELPLLYQRPREQLREYAPQYVRDLWPALPRRPWIPLSNAAVLQLSPLLLVACLLGILAYWISRPEHAKIQRVVGRYATLFIASGLVLTIWLIAAVWLSAVEGEVNGNYRDHWQAGWCVILKISANLHMNLPGPDPTPTTSTGRAAMEIFSWIVLLPFTRFLIPLLKRFRGLSSGGTTRSGV